MTSLRPKASVDVLVGHLSCSAPNPDVQGVRRRTWIRSCVHVAYGTPEDTKNHLLTLTGRLAVVEEEKAAVNDLAIKMSEELTVQKQLVTDYEDKIKDLVHRMAQYQETGTHLQSRQRSRPWSPRPPSMHTIAMCLQSHLSNVCILSCWQAT